MQYSQEMFLRSKSGYSMPFISSKDPIKLLEKKEDEKGINITTSVGQMLLALADGEVLEVSTSGGGKLQQKIKYGAYEVTYGNLKQVIFMPQDKVKARDVVALGGDSLYLEVWYKEGPMDALSFLRMLYSNIKGVDLSLSGRMPEEKDMEMDAPTSYDKDKDEITSLMMRFLPDMFKEIYRGMFSPSERDLQILRNVFSLSTLKNIFFEKPPTLLNPFGMGEAAIPYITKALDTLIEIFLGFMALRHDIFPSSFDDDSKKKFLAFHGSVIG